MARSRGKDQEIFGWAIVAGLLALLAWLLQKKGDLLHESVTAGIVTGYGTTVSDSVTGAPQFDSRLPDTVPEQEAFAIPPIDGASGQATFKPGNPRKASCPVGYQLWHDVATGNYECLPQ